MRSKYRAYPKPGWVIKTLTSLVLLALSILLLGGIVSMCAGCWQSPTNCSIVIGSHRETTRICEAPAGSAAGTNVLVSGHGNLNRVAARNTITLYQSPSTANSNNVQGTLSVPLKN